MNVNKRKNLVEYDWDDCGDNIASIGIYHWSSVEEASYEDHNMNLFTETLNTHCYPIRVSKVAPSQEGSTAALCREPRAPLPKASTCPGCKHFRSIDDWEHTRVI